MNDTCGCGHLVSAHAADGKCTEWWRYPDVLDARQCGCIEVRPPKLTPREAAEVQARFEREALYGRGTGQPRGIVTDPLPTQERPDDAVSRPVSASQAPEVPVRGSTVQDEWRAALAEALETSDIDLRIPDIADTLVPTVSRIVAAELRAAADWIWDEAPARSSASAELHDRADNLDPS